MQRGGHIQLATILAGIASITSIALALIVGYDRAKSIYWDWVVRKLSPEEYVWAAAQFSPQSRSGAPALPPNATLDSGPKATKHGIFETAVASLRSRKWYRGKLVRWRQAAAPDAAGKLVWLCLLHPEVYRRTRPDDPAAAVYR
jgi:hypothetical protein